MSARSGMADLITRLRKLTADDVRRYQDAATGDGSTDVFWLSHNPQQAGGTVACGGTVQGTADYTWDTTYGRVDLSTAPASGVAVAVEYLSSQYTDDELQEMLDANVLHVEEQELRWLPDTIGGGSLAYHRAALGYRDLEGTASGTIYWDILTGAGSAVPAYTPDYITGQVRFAADTTGSAYYWTGRSYDLWAAAADVWERKAASLADWYQFTADGQSFARQQAFQQAREMAKSCRSRTGQNRSSGGLQTGVFVRGDLNARS